MDLFVSDLFPISRVNTQKQTMNNQQAQDEIFAKKVWA